MTARFDWYQGTLVDDVSPLVAFEKVASDIPNAHEMKHQDWGQNGYQRSSLLLDQEGHQLARIDYQGNRGARPNLRGTGPAAPAFADALRASYPLHNVTRMDACVDLLGADFQAVSDRVRVFARQARTSGLRHVPDDPEKGETYTVGAPSSATQFRTYRKDLEMIRAGFDRSEFPQPIVRLEQQANPKGYALRQAFARLEPDDVFGVSQVGRAVAAEFMGQDAIAIQMMKWRPTDYEKGCTWIAKQARNILLEMKKRHPTPEQFCEFLFEDLLNR